MQKLDYLLNGLGFLKTANGKVTIVSDDLSSQHLRILAEIGLADCYYHLLDFEAVLIRRRLEGFHFGFHIINDKEVFSTKNNNQLDKLQRHAEEFDQMFLKVDRLDMQHFQALSKKLTRDKLVKYLEPESHSAKKINSSDFINHSKFGEYKSLVDAVAEIEGTKDDVQFLRKIKHDMKVFIGDLNEQMYPLRGIAGKLALEEALSRGIKVDILTGPHITIGKDHEFEPFEYYFGRTYKLRHGEIKLILTNGNSMKIKDTLHINQNSIEESSQLLYNLAEEADEISPILCDPAIIMLKKAFDNKPSLGILLGLNRLMMYRGAYHGAAHILYNVHSEFLNSPDLVKSDYYYFSADAFFRLGELNKAEADINSALAIDNKSYMAHLLMGCINQVRLNYNLAEKNLEKSLELNPDIEVTKKFLDRTRRAMKLL